MNSNQHYLSSRKSKPTHPVAEHNSEDSSEEEESWSLGNLPHNPLDSWSDEGTDTSQSAKPDWKYAS